MSTVITDYTLVGGDSDTSLIQAVKKQIANGWRPIGSPIVTANQQGQVGLLQAMIR
jgi:hypothetical protein